MSLRLIMGPSGSGKSHYLFSEVVAHAKQHPEQTHLVLVPDQFTMQTQRQLVAFSPRSGILNIEALSFERLAYRVFGELGTDTANVLEDTGKSLLLRKICQDLKEELLVLSGGIDKPGFIDELKSLLSEFAQYDIAPEDLEDFLAAPDMGEGFYRRITDIKRIYRAYMEALEGAYITTEQVLSLLSEVAERSSFLRGAYLVFDGYTGFTPIQNNLFYRMLCLAERVKVSVTMDAAGTGSDHGALDLYHMSREFVGQMERQARLAGVEIEKPVILQETGGRRFVKGGMLSHLEANLYRSRPSVCPREVWEKAGDTISLVSLESRQDELIYAADHIRRRIAEDGQLHFRDFAVLCPDINDYRYIITDIFEAYDIPVFVDAKDVALRSPFVELVSSVTGLFVSDFSYEAVMRLLKCHFLPIEDEDIDLMDNYLLATGLCGRKRFGAIFDRFAPDILPEELVRINEVRSIFFEPFSEAGLFPKRAAVEVYVRSLYDIILRLDCEKALWQEADRLEEEGEAQEASRILQIYPKVMELLDKMIRLMGETEVELEEFDALINEGLSAIKIGVIPPSLDSVVFGDMERTRVSKIDTLFLVGMSDQKVPGRVEGGGLLLGSERERLMQNTRIVLAPTIRERVMRQRFYLYLALTKPRRELILMYPRSSEEDEEAGESYLFAMVRELFEDMATIEITAEERMLSALSEATLSERIAGVLREYMKEGLPEDREERLFGFLSYIRNTEESLYERLLSAAGFVYRDNRISRAVMKALHSGGMYESSTRLEQYAACAYAYFLEYAVQLAGRAEPTIGAVDLGNLYHEVLELYSRKLQESGRDWFSISEEESEALLSECIEEATRIIRDTRINDRAREAYILERMKQTLRRTIRALTHQVRQGSFVPKRFEVKLSELSETSSRDFLSDGTPFYLSGIIDRLDTYEEEDTVYIKIIDYKSGALDLDVSDVYEGLQLQLMLYLKSAVDAEKREHPGKEIVPSAVFYYQVKNPIVDAGEGDTEQSIGEKLVRDLRMKGFVCEDDTVLAALDQGLAQARQEGRAYASVVIPVGLKKDGGLSSASRAIDRDSLMLLSDYAKKKALGIGEEILAGRFPIRPYRRSDGSSGCDYCPYHSVCGMDPKLAGFTYRRLLEEKDTDIVLEKIRHDMQDETDTE